MGRKALVACVPEPCHLVRGGMGWVSAEWVVIRCNGVGLSPLAWRLPPAVSPRHRRTKNRWVGAELVSGRTFNGTWSDAGSPLPCQRGLLRVVAFFLLVLLSSLLFITSSRFVFSPCRGLRPAAEWVCEAAHWGRSLAPCVSQAQQHLNGYPAPNGSVNNKG